MERNWESAFGRGIKGGCLGVAKPDRNFFAELYPVYNAATDKFPAFHSCTEQKY